MGDKTGYGAVLLGDDGDIIDTINGKLNDDATVFQAESSAIKHALSMLYDTDTGNAPLTILTDSQALLQALGEHKTDSQTIMETKDALNDAGKLKQISIRWIKAHVNHYGNELADILAKDGAEGLGSNPPSSLPTSATVVASKIDKAILDIWNQRWKNGKDARQTRLFLPGIDKAKSRDIRKLSRENLSRVTRAITGHDFRRRHESLVTGNNLGLCRFCEQSEESSEHIVNHCPRLAWKRMAIFKTQLGSPINPGWQPKQLAAYLSDPSISEMETPTREY